MVKKKSLGKTIAIGVVALLLIIIAATSISYNDPNNNVLILQFGQIVDVKENQGIYFKAPFIQSAKDVYMGEKLYDIDCSDVITSDKKSMIESSYVTWKVTDPELYYKTISKEDIAKDRIDVAVYNATKKVISSITQDEVITGKDGTLGKTILEKLTSLSQYGIEVTKLELKLLDLPDDNKTAVYERMISERKVIAEEYKAKGKKEADTIKSATDAEVRKIKSEAEVLAAETVAEGESEYFSLLAEAYSASKSREEFYNYTIGLETLENSLQNGGTVTITKDSPLYDILINKD